MFATLDIKRDDEFSCLTKIAHGAEINTRGSIESLRNEYSQILSSIKRITNIKMINETI